MARMPGRMDTAVCGRAARRRASSGSDSRAICSTSTIVRRTLFHGDRGPTVRKPFPEFFGAWQDGSQGVRFEGNNSLGSLDCGTAAGKQQSPSSWIGGRRPGRRDFLSGLPSPLHLPCTVAFNTVRDLPDFVAEPHSPGSAIGPPNTSAPQDGVRKNLIEFLVWAQGFRGKTDSLGFRFRLRVSVLWSPVPGVDAGSDANASAYAYSDL